ncbi:DUF2946 family protein [Chitinivorax sp. B]|uniref:DUF2946 family protein n=1 Tax=Chitinivorax sp. B TaxID=2502235 RepID=UPI0010F586B0|nr:DUF2946 family protein [Chitinivorax sp. B]
MDEQVIKAMAKWPNVPAVYGWLRLDRRGRWWVRDEQIRNDAMCAFIGRNYVQSPAGDYYFQNGPQQVFVSLVATPWIYRLQGGDGWHFISHTGLPVRPAMALMDEEGALYLITELGLGLVDEQDLLALSECLVDEMDRPVTETVLLDWLAESGRAGKLLMDLGDCKLPLMWGEKHDLPIGYGFNREPRPG